MGIKSRFGFRNNKQTVKGPLELLLATPRLGRMTEQQRKEMTISCRDTDYIPKVIDAGKVNSLRDGTRVQILHNGLLVEADGYVGKWMTDIITTLKGHHEPQEEKVFYEVINRLEEGATMIELGSYWSYYSLWLKKEIKDSVAICLEPDPHNRELGKRNATLNKIKGIKFIEGAVGSRNGEIIKIALDSDPTKIINVPVYSVDELVRSNKLRKLDILHMDVQGYELDALKGAEGIIASGKLRFLFVSTHHYLFSGSPTTHADCLSFIEERGGHIISSHTIPESYSGDGLIVASFDDRDRRFWVETSINHSDRSLFRTYEEDLKILIDSYENISPREGAQK